MLLNLLISNSKFQKMSHKWARYEFCFRSWNEKKRWKMSLPDDSFICLRGLSKRLGDGLLRTDGDFGCFRRFCGKSVATVWLFVLGPSMRSSILKLVIQNFTILRTNFKRQTNIKLWLRYTIYLYLHLRGTNEQPSIFAANHVNHASRSFKTLIFIRTITSKSKPIHREN